MELSDDARALIALLVTPNVDVEHVYAPDAVWEEVRAAFPPGTDSAEGDQIYMDGKYVRTDEERP